MNGDCIHELYPMFEMKSFKEVTRPSNPAVNDDSLNGVVEVQGSRGSSFNVVSDPTPPQYMIDLMKANNARGATPPFGASTGDNPFWTYACPACDKSGNYRPGENRYPELYRSYDQEYFRVQIHELGAALTRIRNQYYPPEGPMLPYPAHLNDNGLYKNGHDDDGPAMEDCVGRSYYKMNGLTPHY
jgi:hypothetical protein